MRNLLLLLGACLVLVTLSGCLEKDHSHNDGSHTHDNEPKHHNSLDN